MDKMKKIITALILILLIIAGWYFYPCFNYKGTYVGTMNYYGSNYTSIVTIDDKYVHDGFIKIEAAYKLNFLKRSLLVDLGRWSINDKRSLFTNLENIPIKLGWGSINQPTYPSGWIKHKKTDDKVIESPAYVVMFSNLVNTVEEAVLEGDKVKAGNLLEKFHILYPDVSNVTISVREGEFHEFFLYKELSKPKSRYYISLVNYGPKKDTINTSISDTHIQISTPYGRKVHYRLILHKNKL